MTIYTAPVEEMMFLFDNLKDNQRYNEIEKYKEINSELVKGILEEAAKINQELILPLAKAGDENPCVYENGVVRTPPGYKEVYKKSLERLYETNERVNGEFYVDTLLNTAIELGYKVKNFEIDHYICWGTPNDLKTYRYWQRFFTSVDWHPYDYYKDFFTD